MPLPWLKLIVNRDSRGHRHHALTTAMLAVAFLCSIAAGVPAPAAPSPTSPLRVASSVDAAVSARDSPLIQQSHEIAYGLTVNGHRARHFTIHISVPRDDAKVLEFAIPAWTPGYYQILHFESGIDRVRARDETGRNLPVAHSSPRTWTVTASGAGRTISLDYDVAGSDKGLGFFGSMLDERRQIAYVNGASAFMYVQGLTRRPVSLSITLPAAWKCATPLAQTPSHEYFANTYDDLIDCPLQMGVFDTLRFSVATTPFECIVVGDRHMNAAAVTRALKAIAVEVIGMFGSAPFQRYCFIFHIGEEGFVGGLEHLSSTVIHLDDPLAAGDDDEFITTSAHELFHAWNVKQIRPVGLGPFDYSQIVRTPALWFAEGVTDYYADLLPVRAGLRTQDWFVEQMAQRIRMLDASPARTRVSLEQASLRSWEGQSEGFGGLNYYVKGSLVGFYLDLQIRASSAGARSLDDVLRGLYRAFGEQDLPYPPAALAEMVSRIAGRDQSGAFRKYVQGTDEIAWDEVLPGAGFRLNRQEDGYLGASFVPEMPVDETDDREDGERPAIVQRVEPGYPAAAMDLRPGDRLLTIDGREVTYGIAGALVRSLPAGVPVNMLVQRHGLTIRLTGNAGTQYSHHTLTLAPATHRSATIKQTLESLFAPAAGRPPAAALTR